MVILDLLNVDKKIKEDKMILKTNELKKIKAGASISTSLINSFIRGINSFLDIGRYFGSSIRRIFSNNSCPIR